MRSAIHLQIERLPDEVVEGEEAGEQGERAGFVFTLSRQSGGEFDSCWMTDSVVRFRVRSEPRPGRRGELSI